MNKFNIGDIVVPGKKADERYRITNRHMKKAEVIGMGQDSIQIRVLQHEDDSVIGNEYRVDESCFEKARKSNETIVIYRKGNTVIATDKSTGKTAQATCMDSDTFNLADGQKLAFYRLMGTPEEKIREMLPHMFKKRETEKPFVIKQDHYNVGDKVLIVDEFTPECCAVDDMKNWLGTIMTIRRSLSNGRYYMKEDESVRSIGYVWNENCIVGKVIDGVKKVKRVAKAGEYVLIVNPLGAGRNYKKGDIVRILGTHDHGIARYGNARGEWLFEREYVVLDGYKPEMQDDIKTGDMVNVVDVSHTFFCPHKEILGEYHRNFVPGSRPKSKGLYRVLNAKNYRVLIQDPKTTQVFIVGVKGIRKVEK